MSNPDDRVEAANRLGAEVTYDHPVPPRRDRFGAPWCPVCHNGLKDPIRIEDGFRAGLGVVVKHMTIFESACSNCKQVLTWTGWQRLLSDSERLEHLNSGCRAPDYCFRCKPQLG